MYKIAIIVVTALCVFTVGIIIYGNHNGFDNAAKKLYANCSLDELEKELTEEDGSYVVYDEYNDVYNCSYIIAYKKHGDLIRLIRMNSVVNIENIVKKIIYGRSTEQQTICYLQLPEDARAEDFSWIPDLEIEYKANISEIETLIDGFDYRNIAVSDWGSGYYYHRGLLTVTCDCEKDAKATYKLILPMEASPDSNIKHAGPPAIEVGIDEEN